MRSAVVSGLTILLSVCLAVPPEVAAQNGQRAGQVTGIVPSVNLERGTLQMTALSGMPVFWNDIVNTGHLARARVTLDDGSILNVGSDSNLRVVSHDAATQQTELELNYGRVKSEAVHLTKPGAKFQIRTPTGVAGVVGTVFFLSFVDYITQLVVLEGSVQFCNLAGQCVVVAAGLASTIRGPNQAPSQPVAASAAESVSATSTTTMEGMPGAQGAAAGGVVATHGALVGTTLAAAVAVPAVAVRAASKTPKCGCTKIVPGSASGHGPGH
jgi:hypothetical protein